MKTRTIEALDSRPVERPGSTGLRRNSVKRSLVLAVFGLAAIGGALWLRSSPWVRDYLYKAKDLEELERIVRLSPSDSLARYYLAKSYYLSRRFSEAEREYEEAVQLDHRSARSYVGLGLSRFERGDDSGARGAFEMAVELDPDSSWSHYMLGKLAWRAGDLELAARSTRRAVEIDPRSDQAWYGLASCYAQRRNYRDAIAALRQAVSRNPQNDRAFTALGELLIYRGETVEGVSHLEHALALNPNNASACVLMGKHLAGTSTSPEGRKRAEDLLRKAIALKGPRMADTYLELGRLRIRAGRASEALEPFQIARKLEPEDERTVYALADAYRRLGRSAEATRCEREFRALSERHVKLQQLEARVHHNPSDADSRLKLARTYRSAGRIYSAADQYSRYIQLRPTDETAIAEVKRLYTNAGEYSGLSPDFTVSAPDPRP